MADINFNCSSCGQNLDAPEDMAGTEISCPACGNTIRVPERPSAAYPVQRRPIPPAMVGPTGPRPPGGARISKPEESGPIPTVLPEDTGSTTRIDMPTEFRMPPRKQRIVFIKRTERSSG
jgi:DNA-directed RNA polymerase subunit RPC12/RpoP